MIETNDSLTSAQPEVELSQDTTPAVQSTEVTSPPEISSSEKQTQGKVFTQDQVNIISADTKRRTEARLRAEFESQLRSYQPQQQQQQYAAEGEQTAPTVANLTEEQLYSNFVYRQQQESMINDLRLKVDATGKQDKLESSGLGKLPINHPIVPMLSGVDNLGDVLDEFSENPYQLVKLLAVTNLNPTNGFKELQKISQSIKRNKEALAKDKAPPPSNQLKPSSYGLGGGELSVSEKRKNPLYQF